MLAYIRTVQYTGAVALSTMRTTHVPASDHYAPPPQRLTGTTAEGGSCDTAGVNHEGGSVRQNVFCFLL